MFRIDDSSRVCVCVCVHSQRKVPDQDVAQGSYIALPLTLLLLLAAYNHEKVQQEKHPPAYQIL